MASGRTYWAMDVEVSESQFALVLFLERGNPVVDLAVDLVDVFGLFVKDTSCLGEQDAAAPSLEQGDPVDPFQFLDVFGDGGLGDVVFVRRLGKALLGSYGVENFQSEVQHVVLFRDKGGNLARGNQSCRSFSRRSSW